MDREAMKCQVLTVSNHSCESLTLVGNTLECIVPTELQVATAKELQVEVRKMCTTQALRDWCCYGFTNMESSFSLNKNNKNDIYILFITSPMCQILVFSMVKKQKINTYTLVPKTYKTCMQDMQFVGIG